MRKLRYSLPVELDTASEGPLQQLPESEDCSEEEWCGPKVEAYFPREIKVDNGYWHTIIPFGPEDSTFKRTSTSIGIFSSLLKLSADQMLIVEGHADEGIQCNMLLRHLSLKRAQDVATLLGNVEIVARGGECKVTERFGEGACNRRVCFFLEEKVEEPVKLPIWAKLRRDARKTI